MAKRRRRGFAGLGVLPVVGALTLPKLALLGAGLYAFMKARGAKAAPAAQVEPPVLPARDTAAGRLVRPNAPPPAAARDALLAVLKAPIGSEQQLQIIGREADNYLASAAKAGIISGADAQRISAQPLAQKVVSVASSLGVTPTVAANTVSLSPTLRTVAGAASQPMATLQSSTLLRLR